MSALPAAEEAGRVGATTRLDRGGNTGWRRSRDRMFALEPGSGDASRFKSRNPAFDLADIVAAKDF